MKAMKYILIVIGLVISLLTSKADVWSKQPEVCMHSTSAMQLSGSSLPQAAVTGVSTTYDQSAAMSGPRRVIADDDEEEKPEGWDDPFYDPLGDALLPLLLLAAGYAICAWRKNKSHFRLATPESK